MPVPNDWASARAPTVFTVNLVRYCDLAKLVVDADRSADAAELHIILDAYLRGARVLGALVQCGGCLRDQTGALGAIVVARPVGGTVSGFSFSLCRRCACSFEVAKAQSLAGLRRVYPDFAETWIVDEGYAR